jgi:hypothetical protein
MPLLGKTTTIGVGGLTTIVNGKVADNLPLVSDLVT